MADARDGWDFDCEFEIPDAQDSAPPASAAPQGDQGWVGFGPSPDVSLANRGEPGVKGAQSAQADGMTAHHASGLGPHSSRQTSVKVRALRSAITDISVHAVQLDDW